jgi:YesN/AraC family two-component response regulator
VRTNATRVVLADDEVLMREGLAGLLERSGFDVVGQSGNASELLELVRELRPDLVIVDIRMPPTHTTEGLEAAEAIREEFPETASSLSPPTCRWNARPRCSRAASGAATCSRVA